MRRRTQDPTVNRRDALRLGGISLSIAAVAAACGDDRTGDDAPGRVGFAPPATDLGDYAVDDSVILRTASSLEFTTVEFLERALDLDAVDTSLQRTVDRLIVDHRTLGEAFGALTERAGGEAWTCANPWYVDRVLDPVVDAISQWDDPDEAAIDVADLTVSWESLLSASYQQFVSQVADPRLRADHADAASLAARHAAWLAIEIGGAEAYIAPSLVGGEDVRNARGGIPQYAITDRFGSLAQIEVVAGPPDENGVRATFNLLTPAANSFVYNELSCPA